MSFSARDYQSSCIDAVHHEWETSTSTAIVLPTGGGKTVVFALIIKDRLPGRALVLAHREELIYQARDKIERFAGVDCGIEMADLYVNQNLFGEKQVVISTVQTQNSAWGDRKRMGRFKPTDFDTLIIDECFPAGTRIDGVPIEEIKHGDRVRTHNGFGNVTRVFKKPVQSMCVITFSNRETLVCTPNHPIWTQNGFKAAMHLTAKDVVVSIMDYEHLPHLQRSNSPRAKAVWDPAMQVLLEQGYHPENFQKARRPDHSVPENQRYAPPGSQGAGFNQAQGYGLETGVQKGQRTWAYDPRTGISGGAWMAMQCDSEHADGQTQWLSELLQIGCREFRFEDWGRGGRILTLLPVTESARPKEGGILEFQRVASVKIYEPSDRDALEWLCPGGFVFNLEVTNGHTYFAEGILVHNCHHSTAKSYRSVIDYYRQNPKLRVLGVTATPDRADEEALGQVFDTVAFDYEILDAIKDGWLVPIDQQFVQVGGLDFSSVRTTAGDLNGADLASVMEEEKNMQGVTGAAIEIIGNRRAILFTCSVKQAEQASEIFNRHRSGMAEWVCGKTNKDDRRTRLESFKSGETQVMCNCGVLTEGFDDPGVEVIIMARPTKSRSLYAQMAGRGTRPLEGVVDNLENADARKEAIFASAKKSCLIVDFVGNSGKHKLMSAADILGGKVSDEAIANAIAKAKKDGGAVRMDAALSEEEQRIHDAIELRRQQEQARKARLVAKVQYSAKTINPFDAFDIQPVKLRGWDSGRTLSEKQSQLLMKQGINPDLLSFTEARQVIGEMFRRWDHKLCTAKQATLLKRHGFETKNMKMEEASRLITQLRNNGWKRPAVSTPAPVPEPAAVGYDENSPF